jgi:hypothetical protein
VPPFKVSAPLKPEIVSLPPNPEIRSAKNVPTRLFGRLFPVITAISISSYLIPENSISAGILTI